MWAWRCIRLIPVIPLGKGQSIFGLIKLQPALSGICRLMTSLPQLLVQSRAGLGQNGGLGCGRAVLTSVLLFVFLRWPPGSAGETAGHRALSWKIRCQQPAQSPLSLFLLLKAEGWG